MRRIKLAVVGPLSLTANGNVDRLPAIQPQGAGMIRGILGVIFGYVVMFTVSFITLTATYMTLGQDRTFQTGTYELTPLWLMFNAVFALAAAVIAGKVCRMIS